MRKYIFYVLCVFMVLCSLAIADQVNFNYSECRSYTIFNATDNSTSDLTICAPDYPAHLDLNLSYGQNATANNVTATCQAWSNDSCPAQTCPPQMHQSVYLDYNETVDVNNVTAHCRAWDKSLCSPANCSAPPVVSANLTYGQCDTKNNFTACCKSLADSNCSVPTRVIWNLNYGESKTANNVTANCREWIDLNMTNGSIPHVTHTLNFGENYTANNFTATCRAWVDLNTTNYTQSCIINKNVNLKVGETFNDTAKNLKVTCTAAATITTTTNCSKINKVYTVDCSSDSVLKVGDQNITVTIKKCPDVNSSMGTCNLSLADYPGDILLGSQDLSLSDCTFNDIANGRAGKCINDSFTARNADYITCQNELGKSRNDTKDANDKVNTCQSGQNLIVIAIFGMGVILLLAVIISVGAEIYNKSKRPR